MWIKRKTRKMILNLVHFHYRKRFDPQTEQFYYINLMTNDVSWQKPLLLRSTDLVASDDWELMQNDDDDGVVYYYYHARTGRTSWLSEDDAARIVQRRYRCKLAKDFQIKDFKLIAKSLRFQRNARRQYEKNPDSRGKR